MNNQTLSILSEVGISTSTDQKIEKEFGLRLPYLKPSLSVLFVKNTNCILTGSVNHGMRDYVNVEEEQTEDINAGEFTL